MTDEEGTDVKLAEGVLLEVGVELPVFVSEATEVTETVGVKLDEGVDVAVLVAEGTEVLDASGVPLIVDVVLMVGVIVSPIEVGETVGTVVVDGDLLVEPLGVLEAVLLIEGTLVRDTVGVTDTGTMLGVLLMDGTLEGVGVDVPVFVVEDEAITLLEGVTEGTEVLLKETEGVTEGVFEPLSEIDEVGEADGTLVLDTEGVCEGTEVGVGVIVGTVVEL